jgi:hypothetical protein
MRIPSHARSTFERYFKNWDIHLPEDLPLGRPSEIQNERGWGIRVRIDEEGDEVVLEVYAGHRMTNDRHFRVHQDGRLEYLEALPDFVVIPAGSSEDEQALIRQDQANDNRRIRQAMQERGLL